MKKLPLAPNPLPPPRFEIINLLDILITLLAFFMLTTVFAQEQQQLGIRLPVAQQSQPAIAEHGKVVLQIDRVRRLFFNGQRIAMRKLVPLLNEQPLDAAVIIQADRSCPYEMIVQLVDGVKQSRLTRIGFEVKPK